MEIYSLYQFGILIISMFTNNETQAMIWGAVLGLLVGIGLFILQGFGIATMAKRRNLPHRFLAFIPFANIYYMGKLAGKCGFFGHQMKKAEIYAMVAQLLAVAFIGMYIAAELFLYIGYGLPQVGEDLMTPIWPGLTGFSLTVSKFYEYGMLFYSIIGLVSELLLLVLVMGVYKTYSPKNYTGLAFLTLFVPLARFITVFALRNNTPIDYEAYMRARRDAYIRYQQQQYGNPYNTPYGNPYNPGYNHNPQQGQAKPQESDPFEEFSSTDDPFEEFSTRNTNDRQGGRGSDDFFN